MKILGTILICIGAFGTLLSLIMAFFCNVKSGTPENEQDVVDANTAIKFYRKAFLVSLVLLAIGIILCLV